MTSICGAVARWQQPFEPVAARFAFWGPAGKQSPRILGQGVASIFVKMAWGECVRRAHALRLAAMNFTVIALVVVVAPADARAQFVCDPAPLPPAGVSVVCTITGNFTGGVFGNAQTVGGGSATTINSGSVAGSISTTADGGGNATATNTGSVGAIIDTETSNGGLGSGAGTATTNNSGSAFFIFNQTFDGGKSFVTNSGSVFGIQNQTIDGGAATTINSGTVGGGGIFTGTGLGSGGGEAAIVNYGKIYGDVTNIAGASVGGGPGNAIFTNYGLIDTTNGSFGGVQIASFSGTASAYNAGRIYGEVDVFVGTGGSVSLSNAGLIDGSRSPFGIAINLMQADPSIPTTLNLLPGSRVVGEILLNGDRTDPSSVGTTVNIFGGRNVSSVLTFGESCFCGGLAETGSHVNVFGGVPYVINGNTLVVLDPTSFSTQDRNVLDFTRTVLSVASSHLTSPAPISGSDSSTAIGFAPSGNVARDMANDAFANIPALAYANQDNVLRSNPAYTAADGTSVWAQGFGGVRVQNADGPNLRSVNQFYGGLIGVDKTMVPGLRAGAFAGGGSVSSQIDMNSGSATSDMGFGGVYARYAMNRAFIDFALLGGGGGNNVKRTMVNNLVAGGYEYASGNYSGWFVSPELAYGVRHDLTMDWTVTPTARVRYIAANFGGYQESGSSGNLTVAARTAQNFEERGELVFTRTTNEREDSVLQINATLGALAWQRLGDANVNTVLLGQALAFATSGQANVVGGYFGGGFEWRKASGLSVFAASEVDIMSDSSHTISGRGGVKLAF